MVVPRNLGLNRLGAFSRAGIVGGTAMAAAEKARIARGTQKTEATH